MSMQQIIDCMGLGKKDDDDGKDEQTPIAVTEDIREDFEGYDYGAEAPKPPTSNYKHAARSRQCRPSARLYFTVPHPLPPHKSFSEHVAELRDAIGCVVLPCAPVDANEAEVYLAEYGTDYAGKQVILNGALPPIAIPTDRTLFDVLIDAEYFDETWPGGEWGKITRVTAAIKQHVGSDVTLYYGSDYYISPVVELDNGRLHRLSHAWREYVLTPEAA